MNFQRIERRLRQDIQPGRTRIVKADGTTSRLVTSNDGSKIAVVTGVRTRQTKSVTYDMIRFAYEQLVSTGSFNSRIFREKFDAEYLAAPCRYSVTGGILVELGIAELVPSRRGSPCRYISKREAL